MAQDAYEAWLKALQNRLEAAVSTASPMLDQERYEEAERAVTSVDRSIYGAVAVARMYRECLSRLVSTGRHRTDKERVEAVFRRALRWARSAYPEPHTQIDADDYERGRAEDLAALIGILGYEPAGT